MSVRSLQLDALERMLSVAPAAQGADSWKVLVFDKFSRDVVALLAPLKKTLWRDHNVTLKMLADGARERIADVTAIYLVQPTNANCALIAKDVSSGLYDSLQLNFAQPIPRPLLERLAKDVALGGNAHAVARVFDQFLSFISLEQRLFSLHLPDSFSGYNSTKVKDAEVEQTLDRAADGLLCAVVTMGRVPIIRCPKGGPAEVVARRLAGQIEALLKERTVFLLESQVVEQRPVLLILDRGHDLVTPLQHSDTYQALIDDLLGLKLNKVEVPEEGKMRVYELDPDMDAFMQRHASSPFQDAIREQNDGVRDVDEKVHRMGGADMALLDESASSDLLATVNAVPELLERKKSLAAHGHVMRAVFAEIQRRVVPRFHDLEQRLLQGRQLAKAERGRLVELVGDVSKAPHDKMRVLLIYAMQAMPAKDDLDELESILLSSLEGKADAIDEAKRALGFCRRFISVANGEKVASSQTSGLLSTVNWQSALQGVQERLQNVANSVTGSATWGLCARAIDAMCSGTQTESAELDYLYFDPKFKGGECPPQARVRGAVQKCVVFIVGGGCYREVDNVKAYSAQTRREVIYGCTEMVSPQEFLRQLAA